MPARNRSNPLALAVLLCLLERPMHPYEIATTLRSRAKDESVRLNYGSLYSVVRSLKKRGMIEELDVEREGRLPERTVFRATDPGRIEAHDWLSELLCAPEKEYPSFEAALSFLPALPPQEAATLLRQRAMRLEIELAQAGALRELASRHRLPRLLWVEAEYASRLKETELEYASRLAEEIESGELEGMDWWREIHEQGFGTAWPFGRAQVTGGGEEVEDSGEHAQATGEHAHDTGEEVHGDAAEANGKR